METPPPASLDTLVGVGTGRFKNVDGFTIEFTWVDAGAPGKEDMTQFHIDEKADYSNVILDVSLQVLTGGNLQAHDD